MDSKIIRNSSLVPYVVEQTGLMIFFPDCLKIE